MSVEVAFANLERDGWAIFPALDRELVTVLAAVSDRFCAYARSDLTVGGGAWDLDHGLRNVWRTEDPSVRQNLEAEIAAALAPTVSRMFPDHRAISFGLTVKLAGVPHGHLPYHRDRALIDERNGRSAVHLWIPLVDVSPENGGLIVVTGSHRTASPIRSLGEADPDPLADCSVDDLPPNAVLPRITAGTILAFDNRTTHASTANRSASDRPALMVALLPHGAPMIEWVRYDDRFELWEVPDSDSSYAHSSTRVRLLDTLARTPSPSDGPNTPDGTAEQRSTPQSGADVHAAVAPAFARAPAGWSLSAARAFKERLVLDWDHVDGSGLQILVERLTPGQPCYKRVRELGLSYNPPRNASGKLDAAGVALLGSLLPLADASIDTLRGLMERASS